MNPAALSVPVVQVAGTNGKGSVCHMLDAILQQEGYTVGRYTSPHLHRVNERITVNGQPISDPELAAAAEPLMRQDTGLTYFEALTVIALHYFHHNVDLAILEVGMGGRYDATSVVTPTVAVITNVTLEHERYLGATVAAIAAEKAGIIKPQCRVVTGCTGEALQVVKQKAQDCNAPLVTVGEDITWEPLGPRQFMVRATNTYQLTTPLPGQFQGPNIALAVATAELLGVGQEAILQGIGTATIPGRMERLGQVMLDGAHNPAAMRALREALPEAGYQQLIVVLGIMEDKNIRGIIDELPEGPVVATQAATPRAAPVDLLARHLTAADRPCTTVVPVATALQHALSLAGSNDLVLVTGSLYLVGEARSVLLSSAPLAAQ